MNSRRVNKVEQSVIHWWVNSMTLFETTSSQIVTSRDMRSALGLLIDKFPYLTFRIERNSANELIFIENSSDQIENYEFTWNEVKTEEEFNNWPTRLNIFASKGDFTKQLFNIEVDVFQNRLYRLYFRISHAAADGRSVFALLNDLMTYLDAILSGQHQSKPEVTTRKTFLNVHEHLPDIYDLEKLKSEPIFIDNRHKSFGEKAIIEPDVSLIEKIRSSSIGHYAQLDENDSRDLFRKCKQYGVSIQGIFSVAKMISLLNETKTTHSHTDESFEVLNAIPCDMRYFFNLASDDLIKDPIWKLAQTASEEVVRRKSSNEGLKNWTKLLHGIDQVKACMYATSMGKVSINEEQLKSIRINDLRFFASTSGVEFRPNGEQTPNIGYMHTFTFQNRLNLTFTHSFPRLSYKWGEEYLNRIVFIIHRFLEGDEKSPLLKDLLN